MPKRFNFIFNSEFWRLLSFAVLGGVLFWPALREMFATWMADSNNSHGLLVPVISAYIVREKMRNRAEVFQPGNSQTDKKNTVGLVILSLCLIGYIISQLTDIGVLRNLTFVGSIHGIMLFCYGWPMYATLWFPLYFLFFMVPVPTSIYSIAALPMQLFATRISVLVFGLTPLNVSAVGNIISIDGEMLTVAEACSGLRSLMSFIILSLLFAYRTRISYLKKTIIIASAVPIAIVGNIVRIVFTGFIAYLYGAEIATGFIHDASGYIMFAAAFLVFFFFSRALGHGTAKDH